MTKKTRRNRTSTSGTTSLKDEFKGAQHDRPLKDKFIGAFTAVVIAYLAVPLLVDIKVPRRGAKSSNAIIFNAQEFTKSSAETIEERLLDEWQPGESVAIQTIEEGNRGLFSKQDKTQGEILARVQYPDLEAEITREYPTLKSIVESALSKAIDRNDGARKWTTLTTGKVLSMIKFLLEDSRGKESIWESFIESIPSNVTNMAWYWSNDEKKCVVQRPDSETLHLDREIFHSVMNDVKDSFLPLQQIYTRSRERVEWAYLMLKTRGFGQYFLPVLHLANHNPLEAVPAFLVPHAGSALLVAAQDVKAGDPIYTSYGTLTPVVTAEQYGFVDPASAYIEVPSILEDILQSERTKNERLCNADPVRFFGSVPTKKVGAKYKNAMHSTYFKAFMPDERSYACIRVLLQTERDTDVAGYIAEKIEGDYARYKAMAEAPHCQSNDGNYPLIRKANEVTARLLWGALEVAQQGRDFKISYPGIPTYVMNYS